MKINKKTFSLLLAITSLMAFSYGCNNDNEVTSPDLVSGNVSSQAMLKVVDNSPSVNSFTPNYNEAGAMAIIDSTGNTIYPVKVGQKIHLVNRSLTVEKDTLNSTSKDSTATGTLVENFEGELIISGSLTQPDSGKQVKIDTVIHKSFSSSITRIITFQKVDSTGTMIKDWKVTGVSLPAGGTAGDNVVIQKITLSSEDGTSVEINDPNAYFFNTNMDRDDDEGYHFGFDDNFWLGKANHHWKWKFMFMNFRKHQKMNVSVEILSRSSSNDFITITHGAGFNSGSKYKNKFGLVTSVPEGAYFRKTYKGSWYTSSYSCRTHAVINVLSASSVSATGTNVDEKTWGIPYKIF